VEVNYVVKGFYRQEKGETVVTTEEKRATMVTVSDRGSTEGSFRIFEIRRCG